MKNIFKYISVASAIILSVSCSSLFKPLDENVTDEEYTKDHPEGAEGLLLQAYATLNNMYGWNNGNSTYYLCVASDEAVSNKNDNALNRSVRGELSTSFNPIGNYYWNQSYRAITYVNKFLSMVGEVHWYDQKKSANDLFARRLSGEALALRAMFHQTVFQFFAGKADDGKMYGVPYFDRFLSESGDFLNYQRLPFDEMVEKINADYETAYQYLPWVYSDDASTILDKDKGFDSGDWFLVNGEKFMHRINAEAVRALQARLMLFAGSKAMSSDPDLAREYNERAARYAAEILGKKGYELAPDGVEFYNADADEKNPEILWRQSRPAKSYAAESQVFMPSKHGKGNVNPTQNFVDAFPMNDGTPIALSSSYDPQQPYKDRDPRLAKFVIYNGAEFKGEITDITPSSELDGLNKVAEQSTRTGYYLKKLLREDVTIPLSGSPVAQQHIIPFIRYTEIFFILAEAQNNVGGPDFKAPGSECSARDIMRMIRQRGIGLSVDSYLDGIAGDDAMMALIQNERSIELSFEGFRYTDMRRWGLPLDESIKGYYNYDGTGYSVVDVEERPLADSKYLYMPLLRNDVRQFGYTQNMGW